MQQATPHQSKAYTLVRRRGFQQYKGPRPQYEAFYVLQSPCWTIAAALHVFGIFFADGKVVSLFSLMIFGMIQGFIGMLLLFNITGAAFLALICSSTELVLILRDYGSRNRNAKGRPVDWYEKSEAVVGGVHVFKTNLTWLLKKHLVSCICTFCVSVKRWCPKKWRLIQKSRTEVTQS